MGVGRIFSRGAFREFFQNFSRGAKSGKLVFSLSKLRKSPFLLKFSKSSGGPRPPLPPLPPLSDAHVHPYTMR